MYGIGAAAGAIAVAGVQKSKNEATGSSKKKNTNVI
jgi:hypothetical protein